MTITYLSVVVGELFPKTIALRYPTQVLNFGAAFLHIGNRALGPIVTLLEVSTRWLVRRILPASSTSMAEAPPSELDLQGLSTHQRLVSEGVVADAELADAGVIFGTGFAPYTGGPMNYLETGKA